MIEIQAIKGGQKDILHQEYQHKKLLVVRYSNSSIIPRTVIWILTVLTIYSYFYISCTFACTFLLIIQFLKQDKAHMQTDPCFHSPACACHQPTRRLKKQGLRLRPSSSITGGMCARYDWVALVLIHDRLAGLCMAWIWYMVLVQ